MSVMTEKWVNLPSRPGVYLMRDKGGKVIYVGKAKDLRSRVRAYFSSADERSQIQFLVRRVEDIETLVTASDKEALILENNLIKQYKPRYNIRLKDDKSYLSIKVTTAHPWPRIFTTRKIVKDGSRYFGPFSSAVAARETIDIIEKHFLLRNCTDHNFRNRSRPCLQYQIKRCMAPCVLPVSEELYREQVRQEASGLREHLQHPLELSAGPGVDRGRMQRPHPLDAFVEHDDVLDGDLLDSRVQRHVRLP